MRASRPFPIAAVFSLATALLVALLVPGRAEAGSMDPAPERLALQPPGIPTSSSGAPLFTCQGAAADPESVIRAGAIPRNFPCVADDKAFRNLVSELAFAVAPPLRPARTTGYAGLAFAFEATFTSLNADARTGDGTAYWRAGTRGPKDGGANRYPNENASPASTLGVYSLRAEKGLPLGFQVDATAGFVGATGLWVLGGDARWAPLEGFRTGPLAYVPDVAVGGGVRTVLGSSTLSLTTLSVDVVVSKPVPGIPAGSLEPFLGVQRLYVLGASSRVDLTPNVDALGACGYAGANATTGAPVCANRLSDGTPNDGDLANDQSFSKVRVQRNRVALGATYRYEIVRVGAEVLTDLTAPSAERNGLVGGRQWTMSLEGGVSF